MRAFYLIRNVDDSGISGTGVVAEGIEFGDKTVVIRWRTGTSSTVLWKSIDDAMEVHGHNGHTYVSWISIPEHMPVTEPINTANDLTVRE